ncbi:hypothetical protein GCM10010350_78840 [Streptomyces galilaeus]|nr:hypothetical protein GCM10010350_78840 [Streptomyces galilaeus]
MELVRATLDPATEVRSRIDSPACQVVVRAAEADIEAGGADNLHRLAVGAGVAAAGLTAWLAQERDLEPTDILTELEQAQAAYGRLSTPVLEMLKSLLTGPPGVQQTAEFMAPLFHEDEEGFYDLIVDLGAYVAVCIGMLNALAVSGTEQTLDDLAGMLSTFYTS